MIKPAGLIITYPHDAFNRRTSKTVDNKTTEFFIRLLQDPIKLSEGLNLYVYVYGNPVNWFDPTELDIINITSLTNNIRFNSKEYPIFDILGHAKYSHPEEYTEILKMLENEEITIKY